MRDLARNLQSAPALIGKQERWSWENFEVSSANFRDKFTMDVADQRVGPNQVKDDVAEKCQKLFQDFLEE